MITVHITRKGLSKIVDISLWTKADVVKFVNAYKDSIYNYEITFKRIEE